VLWGSPEPLVNQPTDQADTREAFAPAAAAPLVGSLTRQVKTARLGSSRWPNTRPSPSRRANQVGSGVMKVASRPSWSFGPKRQNLNHRKTSILTPIRLTAPLLALDGACPIVVEPGPWAHGYTQQDRVGLYQDPRGRPGAAPERPTQRLPSIWL
jgi:hypothetical protein